MLFSLVVPLPPLMGQFHQEISYLSSRVPRCGGLYLGWSKNGGFGSCKVQILGKNSYPIDMHKVSTHTLCTKSRNRLLYAKTRPEKARTCYRCLCFCWNRGPHDQMFLLALLLSQLMPTLLMPLYLLMHAIHTHAHKLHT